MAKHDADIFLALQRARDQYESALELSDLARSENERRFPSEPVRNVLYPLDLVVDPGAVNALVG